MFQDHVHGQQVLCPEATHSALPWGFWLCRSCYLQYPYNLLSPGFSAFWRLPLINSHPVQSPSFRLSRDSITFMILWQASIYSSRTFSSQTNTPRSSTMFNFAARHSSATMFSSLSSCLDSQAVITSLRIHTDGHLVLFSHGHSCWPSSGRTLSVQGTHCLGTSHYSLHAAFPGDSQ